MNIKEAYKYQLNDHKKSIAIFYFIMLSVYILVFVTTARPFLSEDSGVQGQFGGTEMASAIFLFVSGLCSFKENFLMLSQNGISRKTIFMSRLAVNCTIVSAMAFIDTLLGSLLAAVSRAYTSNLDFLTMYTQIYNERVSGFSLLQVFAENFMFCIVIYLAMLFIGYFITIMFYRLNKVGKVVAGAGVPVFLTIILPIIDEMLLHNRISEAIAKLTSFMMGTFQGVIVSFTAIAVIFAVLSWILIRRAAVRS